MSYVITESLQLVTESCIDCGIIFAMPVDFKKRCKELGSAKSFYCPNGHSMVYRYSEKDQEINRLKQEKEQLEQSRNSLHNQLSEKTQQVSKLERSIKTRNRRLKAGVCPCCNRTFQELADHMKSKHPDYSGKLHPVNTIHVKINKKV